jgi:hypothetical protein
LLGAEALGARHVPFAAGDGALENPFLGMHLDNMVFKRCFIIKPLFVADVGMVIWAALSDPGTLDVIVNGIQLEELSGARW